MSCVQVRSGGLAVKHPAFGANADRFEPVRCRNLSRDQFLGSQHRGWLTTLNGAAVPTELLKIKGDVKNPNEDVKHSGSDHPQGILAQSFRTTPL